MKIVGLTGGCGTGKSTISKTFKSHNIPVVDADVIAREIVKPHSVGLVEIIDAFGLRYLKADGTLNRETLGEFVFADPYLLQQLNAIMLPLIQEEVNKQFEELRQKETKVCIYDAPTMCETGNVVKYYPIVVAHCSQEQQLQRLMKRGLTQQQAMNRINSQLPTYQKLMMADFAIDTNGSKKNSIRQTEIIINYLKQLEE
jgi:dephospho-CoA kinase